MTMRRFVGTALFLVLAVSVFRGFGQTSPQGPVLPAPATEEHSAARSARSSSEPHENTNRIVGGELSAGRPFIAALLYAKEGKLYQYCGASVIGDRWLLTAAHCDVQKGELAVIDRSDLSSIGVPLKIDRVWAHQQYNPSTQDNDIALLYLSGPISSAIPRAVLAAPPASGIRARTAGWGVTVEGGKTSLKLREVEVPLVPDLQCKAAYPELTNNMVCAGEEGKDSCQGDSGGPLFVEGVGTIQQFGIVSHGLGCGRKGQPGVYTEVDKYRDWMVATMGTM